MPSGLIDKLQPAGRFQGPRIEGADFGEPADLERYHQAVAGHSSRYDPGAPWQTGRDVRGGNRDTSLGAEKTVADGDQNRRYRHCRGKACNQHHPPHPRE